MSRKIPACIVAVLSGVVVLLGLIMVALSIRFANSEFLNDPGEIGDYKNRAFGILLGASIVAVATGCLGFCLICLRSKVFAFIYGSLLLVAWVGLLVMGIVIAGVSHTSPDNL